MTQYNNNYQNPYTQSSYGQAQPSGELTDGMTISAADLGDYDKGYTLLPEGTYDFMVVGIDETRYQPGPKSSGKIGPCKQIILTLRFKDPTDGSDVDLKHNLYMYNNQGCLGMIASFYDAVGMHKKGEPITFDWRKEVIIGKRGRAEINHRKGNDGKSEYNNIRKMLPLETAASTPNVGNWSNGRF